MRVSCDGSHLPTRLMQMVLERPRLHTQEKKNWNKICVHFSFFVMVIFVYICGWKHTRYETWGERNKKKENGNEGNIEAKEKRWGHGV